MGTYVPGYGWVEDDYKPTPGSITPGSNAYSNMQNDYGQGTMQSGGGDFGSPSPSPGPAVSPQQSFVMSKILEVRAQVEADLQAAATQSAVVGDAWSQQYLAPGYAVGGYSGIPGSPSLFAATSPAEARARFYTDPYGRDQIRRAASAAYGYSVDDVKALAWYMDRVNDQLNTFNSDEFNAARITRQINNGMFDLGRQFGGSGGGGYGYGGGYGGGGGGGGGTTTTAYNFTNPDTARGLVNQVMTALLGRMPTDGEYGKFMDALKQAEQKNPTVTTVEMNADGSGTTMTTTGGTSPSTIAQEFAESRPDYAEFQAATSLMDAFMAALDDPVRI